MFGMDFCKLWISLVHMNLGKAQIFFFYSGEFKKGKVSIPPYELDSISKTIDDVGTDSGTSLICVRPSVCNELDVSAHSSPLSTS